MHVHTQSPPRVWGPLHAHRTHAHLLVTQTPTYTVGDTFVPLRCLYIIPSPKGTASLLKFLFLGRMS